MIFLYIIIILASLFLLYHLVWYLIYKRNFVAVLMYHRVTDDEKPNDLRYQMHKGSMLDLDTMKVKPDVFEKQMAYLKKKKFITKHLDDLIFSNGNKNVYITFDDGYYDNYENAYRILKKYDLCSTFFLTAGLIENRDYMPIDKNDDRDINKLMNWNEIKTMVDNGMQMGSHTLYHNFLTNSGVNLEEEIVDSKIFLENRIGSQIDVFAYPAGMYNDKVLELVKENYSCAVITSRGADFSSKSKDVYLIERETISSTDSMFMFKLKLYGIHRFLRKLPWVNLLKKVLRWILKH